MKDPFFKNALNGIPRVRVVDEKGKELFRGYYFAYPDYMKYPDEPTYNVPLVEGIATYNQGDWGLPNTPRFLMVKPPHRIEIIEE